MEGTVLDEPATERMICLYMSRDAAGRYNNDEYT